jgi:hypothetical protein
MMTKLFDRFHRVFQTIAEPERLEALNVLGNEAYIDNHTAGLWFDADSNRTIDVLYLRGKPLPLSDSEESEEEFGEELDETEHLTICRLLCDVVDDLPPDTFALILNHHGEVLWTSTDQEWESHWTVQKPYKPSVHEYQLPRPFPTLLRSQLTLVGRLGRFVDKVTYPISKWGGEKTAVFKYSNPSPWDEIQLLAHLPADHPHIVGIECLVLEELTGLGVIGFTTRFVDAPTMDRWAPSRSFKLRWLQELMGVLDELHLRYGIHHHDLADRNLIVDPDTDKLVLIDFGLSGAHTPERRFYHRDDLNATVAFLYQRITLDNKYKFDVPDDAEAAVLLLVRDRWVKHPDAELDYDAAIFYDELVAWLKKRRQPQPAPQTLPPRQITYLPLPSSHLKDEIPGYIPGHPLDLCNEDRSLRQKLGRPTLTWHRPLQSKVDPTRRLLATGRYADEEEAVSGSGAAIAVPDPKRGFPQPPVSAPDTTAAVATTTSGSRKRQRYLVGPREVEEESF